VTSLAGVCAKAARLAAAIQIARVGTMGHTPFCYGWRSTDPIKWRPSSSRMVAQPEPAGRIVITSSRPKQPAAAPTSSFRGPGGADTVRSANRESSCARTRCPRSAESGATLLQGQVSTRAAELSLVDAVSECYADPLGFVMCFPW